MHELLKRSGFGELSERPDFDEVESVLEALVEATRNRDLDARRLAILEAETSDLLRQLKVTGASRLVDVFFRDLGSKSDTARGHRVEFRDPEPWEEPVCARELLDTLTWQFRRFLILPDHGAEALALWAAHTWVFERFDITPRLALTSAEKRCGKTTALQVLQSVCRRPLPSDNVTAAAVFRVVEHHTPTLLVDEADTFLKRSDDLRGILNSGHRRGGSVLRTVGAQNEVRRFATWSPCAIAAIGGLPDTLEDRSVQVRLERKSNDEVTERFRFVRFLNETAPLRRKLFRWARDEGRSVEDAESKVPPELHDRAADNWRPLLAVADSAGSEWKHRARVVARGLSGGETADNVSYAVLALEDLRQLFLEGGRDKLSTRAILEAFHAMEHQPWPGYGRAARPITARQLGDLLRRYGLRPKVIRLGGETPRGYELDQCENAFRRYLPRSTRNSAT